MNFPHLFLLMKLNYRKNEKLSRLAGLLGTSTCAKTIREHIKCTLSKVLYVSTRYNIF
jgi:hypothetical protein